MGSGKKVTIGYWYSLGLHMGLGRGPLDEIVEISVGDKVAWSGSATGNTTFRINEPKLFGGEKKEGGIVGDLVVLMGAADQPQHSGLAAMLGGLVPAFRGVTTIFYNGRVSAMTPYPKPWAFRVRRTTAGWQSGAWYPEKAAIWMDDNKIKAMNPAHILYQILTDRTVGRGLPASRLDNSSFKAAADTLHAEGFGLCLKFNKTDTVEHFAQSVLDHVGGALFLDRTTGLLKITLIRGNYDAASLPFYDDENGLLELTDLESSATFGATSEIVVNYISPHDGKSRAVRVKNAASVTSAGGAIVSQTREYPGLPTHELAARVALRDLKTMASGLKRFTVKLDRRGALVAPGDVFRIAAPELGIADIVVRAGRCEYGEGTDGTVTITAVQDAFGLPASSWLSKESSAAPKPDLTAKVAPQQRLFEAGWRDIAMLYGNIQEFMLQQTPDAAFVCGLASRPNNLHTGFLLLTRIGGSGPFTASGDDDGAFCTPATLNTGVNRTDTVWSITSDAGFADATIGTAALIDDEVVRIVAIATAGNSVTVARGCADTIPAPHAAGAVLWAYEWNQDFLADSRDMASPVAVQGKILPETASATLAEAAAAELSLVTAGRAARPYPPANVRLNGALWPATISGALTITWANRNRIAQDDLLLEWTTGNVTPENGQTTTLYIYAGDNPASLSLKKTESGLTGTSYTWSDEDANTTTAGQQLWPCLRVVVESTRDGLTSWQRFDWTTTR
ncbi:MAG: phage tail protein [Zoogloeaceae bacterium]|jgi:hypothetical protein|nr:phage tail protein [Zoogloeaceae bacterium]